MTGPLQGLRVIELAGQGPVPFAGMLLADMGANVLRVDRLTDVARETPPDVLDRGKRSIAVDLKHPDGPPVVLKLAESADAVIEGFRPGVVERLGVGPAECMARNPTLVYGRMTGWGQTGPYAQMAGHDINYLSVSGTLHMLGTEGGPPLPPMNLLADYGGGGLLLAFGLVCAVHEASQSGLGQVIDAAMLDGSALLATYFYGLIGRGVWKDQRGTNGLDGGAHFYNVYATADDQYVAVGTIEPQFYGQLLEILGIPPEQAPAQLRSSEWPLQKQRLADIFRTKTRDEWCALAEDTDTCLTPVLSPLEAPQHPHNRHRGTFVEIAGVVQPAPSPRFSRTPLATPGEPARPGEHTSTALLDWGFEPDDVDKLRDVGALG